MPTTRVSLVQGAYTARSFISAAQRCLNLYPEKGPAGEDSPSTLYLTPGLTRLGITPEVSRVRALYRATNGQLFGVWGNGGVYYIARDWTTARVGRLGVAWGTDLAIPGANQVSAGSYSFTAGDVGNILSVVQGAGFIPGSYTILSTALGVATLDASPGLVTSTGGEWVELLPTIRNTPVKMNDNGTTMVIVDGSALGWTVDLTSHVFATIADPDFYGSNFVEEMDTYLIFNKPDSPIFYCSDSNATTFDPLFFGEKTGYSDNIGGIQVANRNIWLIGNQSTTEIWFDAGAADFPFQIMPGPFIQHGLVATYSLAKQGGSVFWLGQDENGTCFVVEGTNFTTKKISTPAIEYAISTYSRTDDAVGFCYEQLGHAFYWLKFPSANGGLGVDWVYDLTTGLWHERSWLNPQTCEEGGHRVYCVAFCYGLNVAGDMDNGKLYMLDPDNPTDVGDFVERRRGYPHMMETGNRVSYPSFVADVAAGGLAIALPDIPTSLTGGASQVTVISTTFTATDGTLLQDYFPTFALAAGDIGSQYTQIDTTIDGKIVGNMLTGSGTGTTAYLASGVPTSPDCVTQFQVIPAAYDTVSATGTEEYVIGRSDLSGNGYKLAVTSDGSQYSVVLTVVGAASTTVVLGTLVSGYYQLYLATLGTDIHAAVQRSQDSKWLAPDATWQTLFTPCITLSDSVYTLTGNVIIGGTW